MWRWINQGALPAYRFGNRRVLIKQEDLDKLITPARGEKGEAMWQNERERLARPLTKQEQERAVSALRAAKTLKAEMLESRGGKRFSDSSDLIRQMREERNQQLS